MSTPAESSLPPEKPFDPPAASAARQESGKPKFRLGKVLLVVVPFAVLAVAVVALAGLIDVDTILRDLTRPALVPASGQVLYHGQPLANSQVLTQPSGRLGATAFGWTDDEGNFSLKTDVRGNYVDGATVGEHRVTVAAYGSSPGASAPPLLTPQQYASATNTPLRITVVRNPDANQFKLVLEGEPPSRPSRPTDGQPAAPMRQRRPVGSKQDAPQPDAPQPDAPQPDAAQPDAAKQDAPKQDAAKQDAPKQDAPEQP